MKELVRLSICSCQKMTTFLFIVVFSAISLSQTHSIRTTEEGITDSYTHTIFLSSGPVEALTSGLNDTSTDRSYRVVIVGRSIFKNEFQGHDLYVEEFVSGPEGCCKWLIGTRKVDLSDVMSSFKISSEPFGLRLKRWLSTRSFELEFCNQEFCVTDIDKRKLMFHRVK